MAGNSLGPSIMEAEDSRPLDIMDPLVAEDFQDYGSADVGQMMKLLEKHHRAVMEALTAQADMIRQMRDGELSTVPALPDIPDIQLSQQPQRISHLNSNLGTGSAGSGGSNAVMSKLRSPGEQSVAASLFTSYSQEDLQQKMEASNAVTPLRQSKVEVPKAQASLLQRLTRHIAFDIFFGLVVISNAIFIGIDVGNEVGQDNPRPLGLQVVQYIYTVAFTVEIVMRLLADREEGKCRSDDCLWNLFDGSIVVVAWLEVGIDIARAAGDTDFESIAGVSSLRAIRIVRLTRILKTAQVIRILRFVMALRTLVTSILSTLKALFWALLLLFLIIYIFALLFTQAVDEFIFKEDRGHQLTELEASASSRYFGGLFQSMLTLFMSIAGGVSWEDAIAPLMAISTVWLLAFLFYVATLRWFRFLHPLLLLPRVAATTKSSSQYAPRFTYFAVLNVVTGVFCQSAIESAQQDHATVVQSMLENKEAHLSKMRAVFSEIQASSGSDGDGITFAMLEEKMNEPTVRQYLETLGLDVWDSWSFFKLLDTDGGGSIELEEFFMGCLRLGGNARAMDLCKVLQDQQWIIRNQGKFQSFVEMELQAMHEVLSFLAMGAMMRPREAQVKDL